MDRLAKAESATDAKDALVHIGHAHLALLHAIYSETQHKSEMFRLQSAVARIESSISEIVEELRELKEIVDAKNT